MLKKQWHIAYFKFFIFSILLTRCFILYSFTSLKDTKGYDEFETKLIHEYKDIEIVKFIFFMVINSNGG